MADVQKENGYTAIANELLEKIYQSTLTLREMKIVFAVIRFTFGFNRKSAELSLTFLAQATKIPLRHVQTTIKNLITKKVLIIKSECSGIHSRKLQLNKNYDNWYLVLTGSVNSKSGLVLTNPVNSSDTDSVNSSIDQSGHPRKKEKKTLKKRKNLFSLENKPNDLNGQLFYENSFFFIDMDLKNELLEKFSDKNLNDDILKTEFYKMSCWLEENGAKKNYKSFIVNWLSKLKPALPTLQKFNFNFRGA